MTADDILKVLAAKTGLEPIEHTLLVPVAGGHSQYRIVCRVVGDHVGFWRLFLLHILRAARKAPWSIDVSRTYMLKDMPGGDTVVVYAWRLVLQDRKREHPIEHHFPVIRQSVVDYHPAKSTSTETDEVKLYGTKRTAPGTVGSGGYAAGVFNAVVGPAAVAAARANIR